MSGFMPAGAAPKIVTMLASGKTSLPGSAAKRRALGPLDDRSNVPAARTPAGKPSALEERRSMFAAAVEAAAVGVMASPLVAPRRSSEPMPVVAPPAVKPMDLPVETATSTALVQPLPLQHTLELLVDFPAPPPLAAAFDMTAADIVRELTAVAVQREAETLAALQTMQDLTLRAASAASAAASAPTPGATTGGGGGAAAGAAWASAGPGSTAVISGSIVMEAGTADAASGLPVAPASDLLHAGYYLRSGGLRVSVRAKPLPQVTGTTAGAAFASPKPTTTSAAAASGPSVRLVLRLPPGTEPQARVFDVPRAGIAAGAISEGPFKAVDALTAVKQMLAVDASANGGGLQSHLSHVLGAVISQCTYQPAAGVAGSMPAASSPVAVHSAALAALASTISPAAATPAVAVPLFTSACRVYVHATLTAGQSEARVAALVTEISTREGYGFTPPIAPLAHTRLGTSHPLHLAPPPASGNNGVKAAAAAAAAAGGAGTPARGAARQQQHDAYPSAFPRGHGGSALDASFASTGSSGTGAEFTFSTPTRAAAAASGAGGSSAVRTGGRHRGHARVTPFASPIVLGRAPLTLHSTRKAKAAISTTGSEASGGAFSLASLTAAINDATGSAQDTASDKPMSVAALQSGVAAVAAAGMPVAPTVTFNFAAAVSAAFATGGRALVAAGHRISQGTGIFASPRASTTTTPAAAGSSSSGGGDIPLALARFTSSLDRSRPGVSPATFDRAAHNNVLVELQRGLESMSAQRRQEEEHMRRVTRIKPQKHPRGGYYYMHVDSGQQVSEHDYEVEYMKEVVYGSAYVASVTLEAWRNEAAAKLAEIAAWDADRRGEEERAVAAAAAARVDFWAQDLEEGLEGNNMITLPTVAGAPGAAVAAMPAAGATVGECVQLFVGAWCAAEATQVAAAAKRQQEAEEARAAAAAAMAAMASAPAAASPASSNAVDCSTMDMSVAGAHGDISAIAEERAAVVAAEATTTGSSASVPASPAAGTDAAADDAAATPVAPRVAVPFELLASVIAAGSAVMRSAADKMLLAAPSLPTAPAVVFEGEDEAVVAEATLAFEEAVAGAVMRYVAARGGAIIAPRSQLEAEDVADAAYELANAAVDAMPTEAVDAAASASDAGVHEEQVVVESVEEHVPCFSFVLDHGVLTETQTVKAEAGDAAATAVEASFSSGTTQAAGDVTVASILRDALGSLATARTEAAASSACSSSAGTTMVVEDDFVAPTAHSAVMADGHAALTGITIEVINSTAAADAQFSAMMTSGGAATARAHLSFDTDNSSGTASAEQLPAIAATAPSTATEDVTEATAAAAAFVDGVVSEMADAAAFAADSSAGTSIVTGIDAFITAPEDITVAVIPAPSASEATGSGSPSPTDDDDDDDIVMQRVLPVPIPASVTVVASMSTPAVAAPDVSPIIEATEAATVPPVIALDAPTAATTAFGGSAAVSADSEPAADDAADSDEEEEEEEEDKQEAADGTEQTASLAVLNRVSLAGGTDLRSRLQGRVSAYVARTMTTTTATTTAAGRPSIMLRRPATTTTTTTTASMLHAAARPADTTFDGRVSFIERARVALTAVFGADDATAVTTAAPATAVAATPVRALPPTAPGLSLFSPLVTSAPATSSSSTATSASAFKFAADPFAAPALVAASQPAMSASAVEADLLATTATWLADDDIFGLRAQPHGSTVAAADGATITDAQLDAIVEAAYATRFAGATEADLLSFFSAATGATPARGSAATATSSSSAKALASPRPTPRPLPQFIRDLAAEAGAAPASY